jgi:hypothetical protein
MWYVAPVLAVGKTLFIIATLQAALETISGPGCTKVGGPDWKNFNHHEVFKDQIIQAHGRKRSFWSKYEVKK